MKAWKEAFAIARIELSASVLHFLLLFVFLFFMVIFVVPGMGQYLENGFVGFDFLYLLIFTIAPLWAKPKSFQLQKINDGQYASPAVGMLQQLPIQKEIIVKSRFIVSFIYTIPVQLIVLILLYLLSPSVKAIMSPSVYVAFMMMWLSFSVYAGGIFPAGDVGNKQRSNVYIWGTMVGIIVLFIILLTGFQLTFNQGIVYYSIVLANKWPFLSALMSMIVALLGLNYWQFYMKKKMDEIDYF